MPRKATSKAQYRWFKAVESGAVKAPGLPPHKAAEMTEGQSPTGLPERAKGLTRLARERRKRKKRSFRVKGK